MTPAWDLTFLGWMIGSAVLHAAGQQWRWLIVSIALVIYWLLIIAGDLGLVHR